MTPHRDKQDRHETPVGVHYVPGVTRGSLVDRKSMWDTHIVPDNEYEALMECAPFQEPKSFQAGGTIIDGSMDELLTPKEKAVMELLYVGGMSGTEAGEMLARQFSTSNKAYSKTYIYKLRDSALTKLRAAYNVSEETE